MDTSLEAIKTRRIACCETRYTAPPVEDCDCTQCDLWRAIRGWESELNPKKALEVLSSDRFLIRLAGIGSPEALVGALTSFEQVHRVATLLDSKKLVREDIEEFVSGLIEEFDLEYSFPYDQTFCAIAVAIYQSQVDFKEEYLNELLQIEVRNIPMSPKVAKILLKDD